MQLTPAQKTALKTHMAANTNSTPAAAADGTALPAPFVVNTRLNTRNPDDERAIAEWYNLAAAAGDQQPFNNRTVWNPVVTVRQINAKIDYSVDPAGSTDAQKTNNWLRWQSLCWAGTQLDSVCLDMSDPQTRAAVVAVWGDVAAGNAAKVGGNSCGSRVGTNFELVCSGSVVGATVGGALGGSHVVQKDAAGGLVYGQKLTQDTVDDILLNG